jgi:hypothetical protein
MSQYVLPKERDCRDCDVPFKWQLPSLSPTNDFKLAVPENAKKKWPHYSVGDQIWQLILPSLISL